MEANANVSVEEVIVKKPSLFGMILSPSLQFERMRERVKAPIALPLIIMLVLTAITGALASFISLNNPAIKNSEAMEMLAEMNVPPAFTLGSAAVGGLFGGLVVFLLSAVFYKVCMVVLGNDTTYRKLLGVVIFSSVISTLGILVNSVIAFALGGYELTYTSLAPFISNKTLYGIAANIDIFNIWYYVVMGIGLHIVAGLSKNKAIVVVSIVFLIAVAFSAFSGGIAQV